MYRDLLMSSFGLSVVSGQALDDWAELLDHTLDCRRRLPGAGSVGDSEIEGDIARHLDYDLALLRLCTATGIECDAERFGRPRLERKRFEDELATRGIDLDELGTP